MNKKRIIVGISGASGTPLALHFLQALHDIPEVETHLVVSDSALLTAAYECNTNEDARTHESPCKEEAFSILVDESYDIRAFDANISSGSFHIDAMVVIPCSMKTIAGIASGYANNLLLRAADVTIKEKRPLILVARESPLSPIHLKNLAYLSTIEGVSIVPPMLTYYSGQTTVKEMEDHLIGKVLSLIGLEYANFCRWCH